MATSLLPSPSPFPRSLCHRAPPHLSPSLPSDAPVLGSPFHRAPPHLSPSARPFRPSGVVLVQWTPPPPGWYKISFDGSVYHDGSRRASIGGAIRDSDGRILIAFAEPTEHSTLLRGEETQTRIPVAMRDEIVGLLLCFTNCDVRHIYREGNGVAHTLCRQAYHGPGVWFGSVPAAVFEKAEEDRRGVLHERLIRRPA